MLNGEWLFSGPGRARDVANADLLQVLNCQVREERLPDPVVEKRSLIFAKAETAKPPADIHGCASHARTGYLRSRGWVSSIAIEDEIK
jgi:hypothetical protein